MLPSMVTIYFRVYQVETHKRTEVSTLASFLASCGGLLGLFLGVSVLSIIEFFYYSTLRLYLALRRWKSEHGGFPFKRGNVNTISLGFPNVWTNRAACRRKLTFFSCHCVWKCIRCDCNGIIEILTLINIYVMWC